jgi:predicted phosphate transport protein (TIGR00153 family)
MGTFSRFFGSGDKNLQERADELLLEISKGLQSSSAKLCVGAKEWIEGDIKVLEEIKDEIIKLERDMDAKKEELIENVLAKHAYLPQHTQERHKLIRLMDSVIDTSEHAVRVMWIGRKMKPPEDLEDLAKLVWKCTDSLQDAVKYLYSDFEKCVEYTRKVDKIREEARDLQFKIIEELFTESKYEAHEIHLFSEVSHWIVKVAVQAEDTGDFLRELAVKYS